MKGASVVSNQTQLWMRSFTSKKNWFHDFCFLPFRNIHVNVRRSRAHYVEALLEKKRDSTYNRKPMSGFFAVLFALQMCDHVNLYGFDAYTSRKRSYRYHYFDNVQGFTDVHSFDLAIEVYKLVAKRGGLTINM